MTFGSKKLFGVFCCLWAWPCLSCDESPQHDAACGGGLQTIKSAIKNGDPDASDAYRSVMGIAVTLNGVSSIYCSGALVGTHKLLTAAHCVTDSGDLPFEALLADEAVKIIAQYRAPSDDESQQTVATQKFGIENVHIHAGYNPKTRIHDIAIIDLAPNADTSQFEPYAIAADPAVLQLAAGGRSPVTYVGFGVGEDDSFGTRKFCRSIIDSTCPLSSAICRKTANNASYDMPGGTAFDIIDACAPCFGDSGGPVLIDVGGNDAVFAVTSFGDDDCAVFSASTLACDHRIWLSDRLSPQARPSCQGNPRQNPHNICFLIFYSAFSAIVLSLIRIRQKRPND